MWFISRCISIDSLNSCFQQQKTKMSYDFGLCKEVSDKFAKRYDENDYCEPLPKKSSCDHHHYHRHTRRRIPKRYSDIVSPSSKKLLSRKNSTTQEKQKYISSSKHNRTSTNIHRHHSLKPINETIYYCNLHKKKAREKKDYHYNQIIKHNDILAHRMQAAMSSELMNSFDENFIFNDHKQLINHLFMTRSHSFNICSSWNKKSSSFHYRIPRVKLDFNKENIHINEPTPDYDEQNDEIIIRTIKNKNPIDEEPIIDYDESQPIIKCEYDEKSITKSEIKLSSSLIVVPQTSTTNSEEQISSSPPIPPPLPNLNIEQKKITFRCRTIAEKLSSDHKLVLKDKEEINQSESSKSHYVHISKIPQSLSHLSYDSILQLNDHETELTTLCVKPLLADEQIQDCLPLSSPIASIIIENDFEHRSTSSKIYNDYKKRTSLINIPINPTVNQSVITHPMHTHIGLRSSTSSTSTNDKLTDMTLSSKQMNVCVINQLNEHLSTRFRKQQQESCSNNNTDQQCYDPPPEYMSVNNNIQSNVYDEPNDVPITQPICSSSIPPPPPPPPPPPLPVGGFRPIIPSVNRSSNSNSQRTSILSLPHEANNSDIGCSTGTSTISSNLSDTRILRELRENPLFTRAKQHLESEPGSNGRRSGRRLNGSATNLTNTEITTINETVSYERLDNCSKTNLTKSIESTIPKQLETIIMHPNELNAIIGKRTKSTNDINQIKSPLCTKSLIRTQCRKSELELIFQKRAQRSEQNLT